MKLRKKNPPKGEKIRYRGIHDRNHEQNLGKKANTGKTGRPGKKIMRKGGGMRDPLYPQKKKMLKNHRATALTARKRGTGKKKESKKSGRGRGFRET